MSEKTLAPVLQLENITMQFGGVVAINNLSLEVRQGEIVALIGPNGAGKTTAFNCITGVYEPTNGQVFFHGKPIAVNHPTGKMIKQYAGVNADKYMKVPKVVYSPDKITAMGIARTFQNIRLFKSQTAFENVLIATHLRRTSNFLTAAFRLNRKEEKAMREKTMNLLETVGLAQEANELATSLPYGKQRRLEIARALATDPTLLLLDEPAAGMNPQETDELGEFVVRIKNEFNLTVFMIEHDMSLVMGVCEGICVLNFGKVIAKGTADEIQANPAVIEAYLGKKKEG